MDFMLFMLNVAWKTLMVVIGWMVFRYVLKNGSGTVREILEALSAMLKAFGHWVKKMCLGYLNKESANQTKVDKEAVTAAYNEYLRKRRAECMTFEEFCKKMENGDSSILD